MLSLKDTCSTREAAKRLNVALSTVQAWVEIGALQAWKTPGGHRRILNSSVDKLLNEGMTLPRPGSKYAESTPEVIVVRTLIVEDEHLTRQMYAEIIKHQKLPISASFCENGYQALLRIGNEIPELIITDLSMPEMDGFEMIRALRQFKLTEAIPIIVVSGLTDSEIKVEGGLPEGVLLLHKPVDTSQLCQVIRDALSRIKTKSAQ